MQLNIMGNSGWCISNKEVEYRTGEPYPSHNSEFMSETKLEEESASMDALMDEMTLKDTKKGSTNKTTDKNGRKVSKTLEKCDTN